jgi:threonine aldolase
MYPQAALVCLENTHNRRGGRVIPIAAMAAVRKVAASAELPVHLDGARIFNAATALDVSVRDIADQADSVQFCLSKALCAPVGSILAGPEAFIDRARRIRKRLGGSMRQSGVIAAAGLIALMDMPGRLLEDHENARMLAEVLSDVPELEIEPERVETNMVIVRTRRLGAGAEDVAERLMARSVAVAVYGPTTLRYVTHHDVGPDAVKEAATISLEVFKQIAARNRRDASATQ